MILDFSAPDQGYLGLPPVWVTGTPPSITGVPGQGGTRIIEVVQVPGTTGGVTIHLTGSVDDED